MDACSCMPQHILLGMYGNASIVISSDFIIINHDPDDDKRQRNFTVVYRCGISVDIARQRNTLQVITTATPDFKVGAHSCLHIG